MQGHMCKDNILRRWEMGGQERDRGKGGEEERRKREEERKDPGRLTGKVDMVSQICNPSTQEA